MLGYIIKLAINETTNIGPRSPWLSIIELWFILLLIICENAPEIAPAIKAINKTAPILSIISANPPTIMPPVIVPIIIP
jgi:hypothetical protein